MLLVWLSVAQPLMIVHYKLFRHGKFQSHRDRTDDFSIFDFTGPTHTNPAAQAITALVAMLLDPLGAGKRHLCLLCLKLGNCINEWPLRVVQALQISLLIGISASWRKLFKFFEAYPWALAPAFDEALTDQAMRQALQRFCRRQLVLPGCGPWPSTV